FKGLVGKLNKWTSYPLLFSNWEKISIPSVFIEVFNSGYFKHSLKPHSPDLKKFKEVIVFAPHQDDEAIGCGGLLHKFSKEVKITIVFITDGFQTKLDKKYPKGIIDQRKNEATAACEKINADLVYLDIPNEELDMSDTYIDKIHQVLKDKNPDLILSTWIFDRPVKHRICTLLLQKALKKKKSLYTCPLWGYQVHSVLYPNVVIDITEEKEDKIKMIQHYKSQIEKTAYDHYILGLNQWNAQYHPSEKNGWSEVFFAMPVSEWINLIDRKIIPNQVSFLSY
ncbi:unnamed protein product, partial [Chrysoparadoxa australica]